MPGRQAVPTIGMTVSSRATDPNASPSARRAAAACRYAIQHHHATVVDLAPETNFDPTRLDGILLSGGGDIHPGMCDYGPNLQPTRLRNVDSLRDAYELSLIRAALDRAMPILGVCRGAQILGVALGGSLISDIEAEVPSARRHQTSDGQPVSRHWVRVSQDSRLAQIVRASRIQVNSSHHQAMGKLIDGLHRVAWSDDGITEAIEWDTGFVLGVQWHPERMWRRAPRQRRIFEAFLMAANDYRNMRG